MTAEVRMVLCSQGPFTDEQSLEYLPPPLRLVKRVSPDGQAADAVRSEQAQLLLYVVHPDAPSPDPGLQRVLTGCGVPTVCLLPGGSPARLREVLMAGAAHALLWPEEAWNLPAVLLEVGSEPRRVAMAPREKAGRHSIAIFSPKGGVGCTRLALEATLGFRHLGQSVLLGDFSHTGGPTSIIGIEANMTINNLVEVLDELTLQQVQQVAVRVAGAMLLAGPPTPDAAAHWSAQRIAQLVDACGRIAPVTIWDLPPAAGTLLIEAGAAFTHVLCVTTPDAHAVSPLKRVLRQWQGTPLRAMTQLVVNRRTPHSLLRGADIARELQLPLAAELDEMPGLPAVSGTDATVIAAGARRQPHRLGQQIEALVQSLWKDGR